MPVKVQCRGNKCSVRTSGAVFAPETVKRQAALKRAQDHGWKPEESVRAEAEKIVALLLDGRDDVNKLPIPASGKAYARLSGGIPALKRKQGLYVRMARDLADPGESTHGFKNKDAGEKSEGWERSHTEKTVMGGGHYGKDVASHGKTSGKFKFPKNWKVGHAIKS